MVLSHTLNLLTLSIFPVSQIFMFIIKLSVHVTELAEWDMLLLRICSYVHELLLDSSENGLMDTFSLG